MKIALIVVAFLIGITLIVLFVRSRIAPTYSITMRDIPEVVSQLQKSAKDGHFAVFMFIPPGSKDGESINLQYSIDAGTVGLDWVLISPRNIADEEKINDFVSELGYRFDKREMNGVRYLRITGSEISDLGEKMLQDFYQIPPDKTISMITEGFKWQPK